MEPTPAAESLPPKPFLKGKRLPSAIVAGGAAFAMTLAGLGIANAQTDDSTTTAPPAETAPEGGERRFGPGHTHADHHPHARLSVAAEALGMTTADLKSELEAGKSIAQVAEAKGIAPQTVIDALVADAKEVLAKAVAEGRITQAQADARIETLPERMAEVVNRTRPAGAPDGEGHRKGPHGRGFKADLGVAATALGLTPEALRTELQAGKSLATVAGDKGVDVAKVVEALVADAKAHLAQAVTDGKLTQAQADERSANLESRITELVNRTPPADGERGPRPGGRPGHGPKVDLEAAATVLGITPEELRTELRAGKSLATIAGEKGVEVGKIVSALVAEAKAKLAQAVADGKLTQAQADERSANLETRITDLVHRAGRPHDGPRPGPGASADGTAPEAEPATLTA